MTLALAMLGSAAVADSWLPPSRQTYLSADQSTRLTVTPRELRSPAEYFEDKVNGQAPAGAPAGSQTLSATATLEKRESSGRWIKAWSRQLANDVAPVDVLVANAGRTIVTFDDWHAMGYGPNAIAIYDDRGNLVRGLSLEDIFPKWLVAAQSHSVSSIWWRGQPRISGDGMTAIIPIKLPTREERPIGIDGPSLDLLIQLRDGEPVGLKENRWAGALKKAAASAREACRSRLDYIARWNAPIAAPTNWVEQDWHAYLREIWPRSVSTWNEDTAPVIGTKVLRPSSARDYQRSRDWLKEALTEKTHFADEDVRVIGSPDYELLTGEIEEIAPTIDAGQLKGVQLVLVLDDEHSDRVKDKLLRSGAAVQFVNPSVKLPQRPERMMKSGGDELAICQAPPA